MLIDSEIFLSLNLSEQNLTNRSNNHTDHTLKGNSLRHVNCVRPVYTGDFCRSCNQILVQFVSVNVSTRLLLKKSCVPAKK